MPTVTTNAYAPDPAKSKFKAVVQELYRKKKDPNFVRYAMERQGYDVSLVDQELASLQSYETGQPVQTPKVDPNATPGGKLDQTQLTAAQSTALLYGQRMFESGKILDALDESIAAKTGTAAIGQKIDEMNVGGTITGQFVGEEFKKFDQAKRNFINASLRRESGAVISPQEFENATLQYFPVPGDSTAVLDQKKQNREQQAKGFLKSAGVTDAEINFNSESAPNQTAQPNDQVTQAKAWLEANPTDPRAEKVKAKIAQLEGSQSPLDANAAPVSSAAPEEPKGFLSTVGSELAQAPGKFMDRMSSASQSLASEGKVPSLFGRGGLRAAGVIGGTIGDAFVSMTKIGFSALKDEQQQALKATADAAINSETGKAAIQALQAGSEQWNQFKSENPTVAKDIEDAANVISAIPSGFGLRGTARLAADAADLAKRGTKATARAVTGVTAADTIAAEATDTAFRAIKPALKVGRDKKNVKAVVQSAMQAVSDSGISPTNLREFADGLAQTKRTVWSNIEQAIGQGKELKVDMQSISDELLKMSQSRTLSMADRTAASRISELAQNLIADGKSISVPDAEALKEYINSELRGTFGKFTQSAAEVNAKKLVTAKIGEQLDKLLSSVPGEFSAMKKTYGALRQTEEDVLKRIIVFERQNPEGLIDSFSKISGIGNIMKGVAGTVTGGAIGGPSDILRGAAELTVGKIQKAANDSDLLIKKAFETMKKSNGSFEPRSTLLKKLMGKGGMSIQDVSKDVTKQVQYNVSGEWKSVTQLAKEYMAKTAATEEQAFQWAKSKVEGLKGRVDIKR